MIFEKFETLKEILYLFQKRERFLRANNQKKGLRRSAAPPRQCHERLCLKIGGNFQENQRERKFLGHNMAGENDDEKGKSFSLQDI